MAFQRVTLATLRAQLLDRLGSSGTFWSTDELNAEINEAVAIWQLLTGEKVITVTQTVGSTTANLFDVTTVHPNGKVLSIIRITPSEAVPDPLCWTWQSAPTEGTPSVSVAAVLSEDAEGQWDGGGTFTVTWWDGTTTVTNVDSNDLGTVALGSKERTATAPTTPPPEETITVSLTGGSPAVNRSYSAVVQFQQDSGGATLTGNSAGCCLYEPFSLVYEECGGDCIPTGGGGCP